MTTTSKEELLMRLFGSEAYIEVFCHHFDKWMEVAEQGFSEFEKRASLRPELIAKHSMAIKQWRSKVIPNFKRMRANMKTSLMQAKKGNMDYIDSATGNLHGLSKDMDGIGWEWWQEIDPSYWAQYVEYSNKAEQMASNIYYTLSDYWNPGEVTNESITGPISDESLKGQLRPGESL